MKNARPFMQVDVFTAQKYRGNPLAVVLDGRGLETEQMQQFTNWSHLSECTFVLPPSAEGAAKGADYRVRIFCPGRELPFAGHPTLGTCHAWLHSGGQPRQENLIIQECALGCVPIRRTSPLVGDESQLAFEAPALLRSGPLSEASVQRIAQGFGLDVSDIVAHAWCDNGPGWQAIMLHSAEQVLSLKPDSRLLAGMDIGVIGPHTEAQRLESPDLPPVLFEVRAFFPGMNGLAEDPVTGSLNAALAQWLAASGQVPDRYTISQGTVIGCQGRVLIERVQDTLWIGGTVQTCIQGHVSI